MILIIDGVECKNFSIGKLDNHGFIEVFINDYSMRHWLPFDRIKAGKKFRVNGHDYEVKA